MCWSKIRIEEVVMTDTHTAILNGLRGYAKWVISDGITAIPLELVTNTLDPLYSRYLCRMGKHTAMRAWIDMALRHNVVTKVEHKLMLQRYLEFFQSNVKGVKRIRRQHITELQNIARYILQNVK